MNTKVFLNLARQAMRQRKEVPLHSMSKDAPFKKEGLALFNTLRKNGNENPIVSVGKFRNGNPYIRHYNPKGEMHGSNTRVPVSEQYTPSGEPIQKHFMCRDNFNKINFNSKISPYGIFVDGAWHCK